MSRRRLLKNGRLSVPEGLSDRSLAIYCQEPGQRHSVPEGTV